MCCCQHAVTTLHINALFVCHIKLAALQVLCDRLGIFVDGQLVCIGNPKELTARYGGYLVCHQPYCCSVFAFMCAKLTQGIRCSA